MIKTILCIVGQIALVFYPFFVFCFFFVCLSFVLCSQNHHASVAAGDLHYFPMSQMVLINVLIICVDKQNGCVIRLHSVCKRALLDEQCAKVSSTKLYARHIIDEWAWACHRTWLFEWSSSQHHWPTVFWHKSTMPRNWFSQQKTLVGQQTFQTKAILQSTRSSADTWAIG